MWSADQKTVGSNPAGEKVFLRTLSIARENFDFICVDGKKSYGGVAKWSVDQKTVGSNPAEKKVFLRTLSIAMLLLFTDIYTLPLHELREKSFFRVFIIMYMMSSSYIQIHIYSGNSKGSKYRMLKIIFHPTRTKNMNSCFTIALKKLSV
jgi:hypothetical protein